MDIFSAFTLLGGLAFFIYGMNQMSGSLEKIAGNRMEEIINRITKNRIAGLLLGCVLTIAIQSSSAVTVMLVGLVNSGIMDISNVVGVIMGSNIGTTITAWIMSLIGVSSNNVFVKMLKPESFSPLLAFIGIALIMISKTAKKKDLGNTFIGFAILMYGMIMMGNSVEPLADSPQFANILTAFTNPLLGILTGLIVTAVIQSSAASVGMLQALTMTGGITYGMAFPIIMGQNIGTCATAILSSIGVSKNAKRVAAIHLSFNVIGTTLFMAAFYILKTLIDLPILTQAIDPVGVALCHSIFNIGTTIILLPFSNFLVKIATKTIKTEPEKQIAFIDKRLFETPGIAVSECNKLSVEMAKYARESVDISIQNLKKYSEEATKLVAELEGTVDVYEDHLGTYLVSLSGSNLSEDDNNIVAKVLHSIGNFERISDHALNLVESAKEIDEKKVVLSDSAKRDLGVLESALNEILELTIGAYENADAESAQKIEPLEQVIDDLTVAIKANHIGRLQAGECTIERGFVFADILTNIERISDHCSNIAIAVIEANSDVFDPHEYLKTVRSRNTQQFQDMYSLYHDKYFGGLENR